MLSYNMRSCALFFTMNYLSKSILLRRLVLICFFFIIIISTNAQGPFVVILGVVQDAGYPQIGCQQECCKAVWLGKQEKKMVTSLALVDPVTKKWWLFEATPNINDQLQLFKSTTKNQYSYLPEAIFITHAHIGHYTGLMYLGREALNANNQKVHVLPKLKNFLETNGPWSQLIQLKNLQVNELQENKSIVISERLQVKAFKVPHRDEFSETAGFEIHYQNKKIFFIPDIDKWAKFSNNIAQFLQQADYAFIDATFYKDGEIKGRSMQEIPHPFVQETKLLLNGLNAKAKKKIVFIHFNHTNPLLNKQSVAFKETIKEYGVAMQGNIYAF